MVKAQGCGPCGNKRNPVRVQAPSSAPRDGCVRMVAQTVCKAVPAGRPVRFRHPSPSPDFS